MLITSTKTSKTFPGRFGGAVQDTIQPKRIFSFYTSMGVYSPEFVTAKKESPG